MFRGIVVHGKKEAQRLGFPTANIEISRKFSHLRPGVYAGEACYRGDWYDATVVLWHDKPFIEVHMLDYSGGDCYGEEMEVELYEKVSEIEPFTSAEYMREKIANDVDAVRKLAERRRKV